MNRLAYWSLRLSLAATFASAVILAQIDPLPWKAYFPPWTLRLADYEILSGLLCAVELVIVLMFANPSFKAVLPAVVGGMLLVGVVACNRSHFPVVFRNLGLIGACAALAVEDWIE